MAPSKDRRQATATGSSSAGSRTVVLRKIDFASAEPRNPRATLMAFLVIGVCVWTVYGRTLDGPFVYDDTNSVVFNPSIERLWPLVGSADQPGPLNPPATSSTAGRPLVNLSLALNYRFGGLNPFGYHAVNVVLHMLSALLLWALVRRTLNLDFFRGRFAGLAAPLALGAAVLWAVHPLTIDAVAYVTQRTELLVALFYLATLYASLRYFLPATLPARAGWSLLAAAACLLGMACKEVMVTAPVVVLLYERTFKTGSFRRALAASWPLYAGLALSWLLLLALNYSAPRAATAGFHLEVPPSVWWFTQAKVLCMYLKLALWPWPLVIHYEFPYLATLAAAWPWLLGVALLASATVILVWRRTAAGFIAASALLILSPTLVVPIATEVAAERRMYLPLAGIVALCVVGVFELLRRAAPNRWPVAAILAASALVVVAGAVSARRLAAFQDAVTLWQDNLAHTPDSSLVHTNLGLALIEAGRPEEAIPHYDAALRLEPAHAATHRNNLAYAYLRAGQLAGAIEQYEIAVQEDPDLVEAHNNLGMALMNAGRPREAIEHFQQSLRLRPDHVAGYLSLGAGLAADGRPQEALAQFQQALRLQPDSVDAWAYQAKTYTELNEPVRAIESAAQAVALARAQGRMEQANQIAAWLRGYRASTGQTP